MFGCIVKIVYIFITIFSPLLLFVFSFTARLMMISARRSKDNENDRVQCPHTHARTGTGPEPTNAAVELENMPFCGLRMAMGGAQLERLEQVFISAFWFICPAHHPL